MKDAMSLHASGYIVKPITEESVRKELEDLRHPLVEEKNALLVKEILTWKDNSLLNALVRKYAHGARFR